MTEISVSPTPAEIDGMFQCDLCGEWWAEAYRNELFARYRTPDVSEVCNTCHDDIRRAWRKASRVTDGLLNDLTRRAIRRMRILRHKWPLGGRDG